MVAGFEDASMISRLVFGFVAGLLSVLVVHQTALYFGARLGFPGGPAWSMAPWAAPVSLPLRVPQVVATALLGGLWGVALTAALPRIGAGLVGAVSAVLIFALLISAVGWLHGPALTGGPGFVASRAIYPLAYNAVWAIGALAALRVASR
jgi:hypothetical protein